MAIQSQSQSLSQFAQHPSRHAIPPGYPSDPNLALTYDPHAGAMPQAAASNAGRGLASGWVSTGFGLFQLMAPQAFLRAVGMPYSTGLIRVVGARDLLLGLGLLARPSSSGWREARYLNDLLDTTLIAMAYLHSPNRRRLSAFAALVAGVILLDRWTSR
jgi:hypothetical protein